MVDYVLILLSFAVFWLAVIGGYGALFPKYRFGAGATMACLVPGIILSPLSLLGQPLAFAVFILGGLVLFFRNRPKWMAPSLNLMDKFLILALAALGLCRLAEATLIQPHGDSLYYNLVSAIKWSDMGNIAFVADLPLLFQSSNWDYIYLWPAMIFPREASGLASVQIFAQLTHFSIAYVGSLWTWNQIARHLEVPNQIRWATLLLGFSSLWWTAVLAKNDWAPTLWFLSGWLALLMGRPLPTGIFWGLAMASKWTSLFSVFPFALLGFWQFKGNRARATLVAAMALGVAPIAARNFIATGNPIFPIPFLGLGESYLSLSFLNYIEDFKTINSHPLVSIGQRSLELFKENWIIPLGLLSLLFSRKVKWQHLAASVAGLLLFSIGSGQMAELRLIGPTVFTVGMLAATQISLSIRSLSPTHFAWIISFGFLALSRMPTHALMVWVKAPSLAEQIGGRTNNGAFKLQVREIVSKMAKTERILTSGDNEHFYLSDFDVADLTNIPGLDQEIEKLIDHSVLLALQHIRQSGFRYLLHVPRNDGVFWPGFSSKFENYKKEFNYALILADEKRSLFDLNLLPTMPPQM